VLVEELSSDTLPKSGMKPPVELRTQILEERDEPIPFFDLFLAGLGYVWYETGWRFVGNRPRRTSLHLSSIRWERWIFRPKKSRVVI